MTEIPVPIKKENKKEFWRGWHDGRYGIPIDQSILSKGDVEDYYNGWIHGYYSLLIRGKIEEGEKIG